MFSAVVLAIAGFAASSLWTLVKDKLQEPVTVLLGREGAGSDDHSFVIADVVPPQQVRSLGEPDDLFRDSALRRRATKVGVSGTKLTIEGANSHTVVITEIHAKILRRDPLVTGTLLSAPPQGIERLVRIGFDLDQPDPIARVSTQGELGEPYFASNAVTLKDHETATFQIDAHAAKATYTWAVQVDLVVDGRAESRTVQSPDGPLRLAGSATRYGAIYDFIPPSRWSYADPAVRCNGLKPCR